MDKKLKAKWVKALRSDQFTQLTPAHAYESEGKHCCLGVLAVLGGQRPWQLRPWLMDQGIDRETIEAFIDVNDEGVPFEVIAGLIAEAL